jgi:hypothetical protein
MVSPEMVIQAAAELLKEAGQHNAILAPQERAEPIMMLASEEALS